MNAIAYLASDLSTIEQAEPFTVKASTPLDPPEENRSGKKEELRHILLGSPGDIRQTIYLLHSLRYAEPVLWTPITAVRDRLVITPEQGEAMSLLRRSL